MIIVFIFFVCCPTRQLRDEILYNTQKSSKKKKKTEKVLLREIWQYYMNEESSSNFLWKLVIIIYVNETLFSIILNEKAYIGRPRFTYEQQRKKYLSIVNKSSCKCGIIIGGKGEELEGNCIRIGCIR